MGGTLEVTVVTPSARLMPATGVDTGVAVVAGTGVDVAVGAAVGVRTVHHKVSYGLRVKAGGSCQRSYADVFFCDLLPQHL